MPEVTVIPAVSLHLRFERNNSLSWKTRFVTYIWRDLNGSSYRENFNTALIPKSTMDLYSVTMMHELNPISYGGWGPPKADEIQGKLTSSFKRQKSATKAFNSCKLLAANRESEYSTICRQKRVSCVPSENAANFPCLQISLLDHALTTRWTLQHDQFWH